MLFGFVELFKYFGLEHLNAFGDLAKSMLVKKRDYTTVCNMIGLVQESGLPIWTEQDKDYYFVK